MEPTVLPGASTGRRSVVGHPVLRAVRGPATGQMWLLEGPTVVGREGAVQVADPSVSRQHVRIEPHPGGATVSDLGSTAGTLLNGQQLGGAQRMVPGDVLQLGASELVLLQPVAIESSSSEWTVQVVAGGKFLPLVAGASSTVGRDPACDVVLGDARVSSRHLRLTSTEGGVLVEDLDSSNGTRVDGRAVSGTLVAGDGDVIELGAPGNAVVVRRTGAVPPTTEVRVRPADGEAPTVLVVEAEAATPIGQIARSAAAELGVDLSSPTVVRTRGGILLLPEDRWGGSGIRRGDELVLVDLAGSWASDLRRIAARLAPPTPLAVPSLPRTTLPPSPRHVRQPTPPESPALRGRGLGWQILGGLAAVSVGLVIAILRPAYAVFGIVAASAGALALGAGILADQARRKGRAAQFRRELHDLDKDLAAARRDQADAYRELSPDTDELSRRVRTRDARLWGRRIGQPDVLSLRLGVGSMPTKLDLGTTFHTGSPLESELTDLLDAHRVVRDVPICVPAASVPSIGLLGDSDVVEGLAGRMLVEAACLHPPTDLRIWVLDPHDTWSWARWLPHAVVGGRSTVADGPADARRLAAELLTVLRRDPEGPDAPLHLVVVATADRPAGTDELVGRMAGRGLAVVTGRSSGDLPSGLAALLQVDRRGVGTPTGLPEEAVVGPIQVDGLTRGDAEDIALGLAPLTMGVRRSSSSGGTGLSGLHGVDPARLDLPALWRGSGFPRVSATLAVDDDGAPVHMAMREHGPHGVIAGITGSGKSELLLSFLAAMALTHSPADLNLFLIDYKGGATFAPLERLPHIVGLVTDLETDGDLVGRAFTALDAEIKRRKQLLADVGVPNVIDYQRRADLTEPMPDLLVVIDEFAELVRQREDVKGRLDTVATQGRSLGIHLLLACQSPTGAVSHAVRTNTNLWVCLRVGRDEESREMLGSVAAARLDDQARGRGFIRRGAAGDLLGFQAVRVTAPVAGGGEGTKVHRPGEPPRAVSAGPDQDGFVGEPATELDLIVDAALGAVRSEGIAPARSLWLDPLPDEILAGDDELDVPTDRLVAHVGVVDRPDLQTQEPYLIDLTSAGNALVCGQLGFGKSTTLRRIGIDLARRHGPRNLHLYALDAGSGSLAEVAELPHCAGVVGVEDSDRVMRLLRRLGRLLSSRRESLAAAGGATFVEWRAAQKDAPWVVLLLDDMSTFRDNAELPGAEQPMDVLNSLLQGGPSVGIHVVIGATQPADLRISQMNLVPERLLFRQAEAADYQTIAVRVLMSNQPMGPPGRAMIAGGHQLQVVRSDATDVERVISRWADARQPGPEPIRRLADEVPISSLRAPAHGEVLLGVGGPELEPVAVDLDAGGSVLAVVGPHGSGRSTALLTLFDSAVLADPLVRCTLVAPRSGPLAVVAAHPRVVRSGFDGDAATAALDQLLASDDLTGELLLIDDAATLAPMVGDRLEQVLRRAATTGLRCVLTARSGELTASYEPWARYVNGLRHLLLLQPSREEAYSAGVSLPGSVTRWPPGRGVLVSGSSGTLVHVALPGPAGA